MFFPDDFKQFPASCTFRTPRFEFFPNKQQKFWHVASHDIGVLDGLLIILGLYYVSLPQVTMGFLQLIAEAGAVSDRNQTIIFVQPHCFLGLDPTLPAGLKDFF